MAPSMAPKGASSAAISEGIQVRGPYQYRAQLRRNGVYQSKTFETLREAQEWRRIVEGKVTGNEFIDLRRARMTALTQACDWTLDRKLMGTGRMPRMSRPSSVTGKPASSRIGH